MRPSSTGSMLRPARARGSRRWWSSTAMLQRRRPVAYAAPPSWLSQPAVEPAPAADTHRDDMAFWMYSSGSTGRPKGIVHLQHDMAYTHASYARHLLKLTDERHMLLGAQDLLRLWARQLDYLSVRRRRCERAAAGPARARGHLRDDRPVSADACSSACRRSTPASPRRPRRRDADLSSLRLAVSAAEVLSAEVFNAWKALSGLEIMEGLGSTEALHIYLSNTAEMKKLGRRRQARPGLRGGAQGQRRPRGGRRRGGHPVGARPLQQPRLLEPARQDRRDHARGRLDLLPATASCAMPTASTSSAAAPTTSSRWRASGSIRWRSSCASPTIRPCASAPCWP